MRESGTGRRTIIAVAVVVLGLVVVGAGFLLWSQDRTLEALRGQPFGDRNVAAAVDVLARSGIATYADPGDEQPLRPVAAPVSPLALLRDQVRAMALEASAGGGIPGTELDALFEPDEELPPASYVVAGYVKEADTPGAELSRRLMGDQQFERASELAYPQLVLVLFTADVIRERATTAGGTAGERAGLTPAPRPSARPMAMVRPVPPPPAPGAEQVGSGPCSAVQNFIDTALRSVFDALRLGESGGVGGFFAKIWNFVVSALEVVVTRLIKTITQKVVDMIARVAAVVGTVATVVSAIRPWTVRVAGEPFTREKGIVNVKPGQEGALVARVDLGGLDEWPAWAQDCATAAGQPLPNLRPEGAPVLWSDVIQNPPALVTVNRTAPVLDSQGSARLNFTTLIDDVRAPYRTLPGAISVNVTVERDGLRQLAGIVERQLLSELPAFVANAIYGTLLKPHIDSIVSRLSRLISVSGSGPAIVLFHVEDPTPSPTPTATPTPTPTPTATPTPRPTRPGGEEQPRCENDCAMSNGDPHIVTVDGEGYDFQAAGEFVLLQSADGSFELQSRQEPYPGRNNVTVNTAVAMRVGDHRLSATVDPVSEIISLLLDGEPITPSEPIHLGGGASIAPVEEVGFGEMVRVSYDVDFGDGGFVYLIGMGRYGLNILVEPSEELRQAGRGVMGTVDASSMGIPALPDGTILPASDDPHERYVSLYVRFADAWRVSAETTLFDYEPGQSTDTFTIREYPREEDVVELADLSEILRMFGEQACGAVTEEVLQLQCIFDVALTGDESFATVYERTQRLVDPGVLPPSGMQVRVVNVYTDDNGPVDVDVYGHAWVEETREELVALLASVPYGQASDWFDPGYTNEFGSEVTKLVVYRRGTQADALVESEIRPPEPGRAATAVLARQTFDDSEPRVSFEYIREEPLEQAYPGAPAPGEGLIHVTGSGWPRSEQPPPWIYPAGGTTCLYLYVPNDPFGFKGPSTIGREGGTWAYGITAGSHELALHRDFEQRLTDDGIEYVCDQRFGPSVPIDVVEGRRYHLFIYAPTPTDELRLLLLPFGR